MTSTSLRRHCGSSEARHASMAPAALCAAITIDRRTVTPCASGTGPASSGRAANCRPARRPALPIAATSAWARRATGARGAARPAARDTSRSGGAREALSESRRARAARSPGRAGARRSRRDPAAASARWVRTCWNWCRSSSASAGNDWALVRTKRPPPGRSTRAHSRSACQSPPPSGKCCSTSSVMARSTDSDCTGRFSADARSTNGKPSARAAATPSTATSSPTARQPGYRAVNHAIV